MSSTATLASIPRCPSFRYKNLLLFTFYMLSKYNCFPSIACNFASKLILHRPLLSYMTSFKDMFKCHFNK